MNVCNDFSVSAGSDCVGKFVLSGRNCAFLPTLEEEMACKALGPASNITFPRRYESALPNWDNFGHSLLQTYMLVDGENWPGIMYNTVDGGHNIGDYLNRDANPGRAIFFIGLNIVMGSVVLDLLIAVVRSTYLNLRDEAGGRRFLTHGERKLLQNTVLVLESAPVPRVPRPPPPGALFGWRAAAHAIVHAPAFEFATLGLVAASTAAVAVYHAPASDATYYALQGAHYTFTCVFTGEVGLRFLADGLDLRARHGWNTFDTATTATALVGMCLSLASRAGALPSGSTVMRVALAVRALRLIAAIPALRLHVAWLRSLQPVMRTLRRAAPRFLQLVGAFIVFLFCYAIVGMAAWGNTRYGYAGDNAGGNPATSTGNVNSDTNFESLPNAFWTLFRFYAGGENWNFAMTDLMVQPPYCVDSSDGSNTCGSTVFSPLYFIPFMFFSAYIFVRATAAAAVTATATELLLQLLPPHLSSVNGIIFCLLACFNPYNVGCFLTCSSVQATMHLV